MKNNTENIQNTKKVKKNKTKEIKIDIKKIKETVAIFVKKHSVIQYTCIGLTLFFLSILLTAQMKSISNTEELLQGKREAELADSLVTLQRKYNDLKAKYEESEKVVEEYQTNAATNDTLISSMQQQNKDLSILSGTSDLKGEGIIITLNDGDKVLDPILRSDALVHDSDIITVVNELKIAGAEAISVNGQRIISTSGIRCVGTVIQVNYQRIAAPFEIKAIGNSQYLESAMNIKNGIVDSLKEYGVSVSVSRKSEVKIAKYDGTLTFKHAMLDK